MAHLKRLLLAENVSLLLQIIRVRNGPLFEGVRSESFGFSVGPPRKLGSA